MNFDKAYVFGGVYDSAYAAQSDFDALGGFYDDGVIGPYQAAMVEKQPDGKVKILDTTLTRRAAGAGIGAAIGAVLGLIYPPSILLTASGGAAVGAISADASKGWTRGDVKRLATEQLMPGQTGIIVVAEAGPTLDSAAILASAAVTQGELIAAEDVATYREMLENDRVLVG